MAEGKGTIFFVLVINYGTGVWHIFDVSSGVWSPSPPEATLGDELRVLVPIINNGATTDTIYAEFVSADVTPSQNPIHEQVLEMNADENFGPWNFIMPSKNVNITINAGHIE